MNTSSDKAPGESGLYNRIAVLRAERGIGRQDLADAMEVNYQTIGFLERGDYGPSLKLAFQIAEYFGPSRWAASEVLGAQIVQFGMDAQPVRPQRVSGANVRCAVAGPGSFRP